MISRQLNVKTKNLSYPVFIDNEPIENLSKVLSNYTKANKFLIVISEKVEKLYGKRLNFKNSFKFVLKDGEKEKNFRNYQKIMEFLLKNSFERKDAIVAIGGGVVGDLAGFVASTYLRGIDFIQIPTTLLACVDSSVGGKTAVNTSYGKNLIGTFYQPKAVFCNLNFLKTLDDRQFKTGLAEVLKYAFIENSCYQTSSGKFYRFLEQNREKLLEKDEDVLAEIIITCLQMKSAVVLQDELEKGLRRILNFGHTYAHAVEKITEYKKFTHGEAVFVGMVFSIDLALKKNLITQEFHKKYLDFLNEFKIVKVLPKFNIKKMTEIMMSDKKVKDGKINFVLPSCDNYVEIVEINKSELIGS